MGLAGSESASMMATSGKGRFRDLPSLARAPVTSDVIAAFIRDRISAGDFAEDEPVRQDDIARLLHVSKIPVREALKRLEAEGLIAFQRNRGAIVTRLSREDFVQIIEICAALEADAIRLATPSIDAGIIAAAKATRERFAGATDAGKILEADWQFHCVLYEPAGRPLLVETIRAMRIRIARLLRLHMTAKGEQHTADREHGAILRACRAGDGGRAAELVRAHLLRVAQA